MADSTRVDFTDTETTSREAKGKAPLLATPPGLVAKGMAVLRGHEDNRGGYKRGIAIVDFILRLSTLAVAIAATAIMGTTDQTLPFFTQFFQFQASYDDLWAFQYVRVSYGIML
ncbi:hypothetical protein RHSIM_Rhsim02G0095500 [Rhododendron simsii]|uniref:CASP-like protein n=1 Tax=Rhododendron simsii TaxID=118357 RepID=A0A834LT70_RHOSS|nr:hypothetical protein RHSIM_Rhsim02G0095500 [Rhododendron simsii]